MPIRTVTAFTFAAALALAGCRQGESGPIAVSAIGAPPRIANPNLEPIDPPSEILLLATAQGLVRFDAAGQIEPALAQSWIVSDDGLRYTFRLGRTEWHGGGKVNAKQVAARLRATLSPASRNPLKPLLGVVEEIVAMTDDVLEISLHRPRPNFLQLLAQPEMALLHQGRGTGPFHAVPEPGYLALHLPPGEEQEEAGASEEQDHETGLLLRGERAALAIVRFVEGEAALVTGGTAGDLPIARASSRAAASLRFDPVAGLFGLSFGNLQGLAGDPAVRQALSMAIDRAALVEALDVPELQPRDTLLPTGIGEVPQSPAPAWSQSPLPMRRAAARRLIETASAGRPAEIRVAIPQGPGYRLLFAHLRRDWRLIGVSARQVGEGDSSADLHLIDAVAPTDLASWYLWRFSCARSAVCDPEADRSMTLARMAATAQERQALLARVDRRFAEITPFIPLTAPVRWSLVSERLTGFRPNVFGRHNIAELVAATR